MTWQRCQARGNVVKLSLQNDLEDLLSEVKAARALGLGGRHRAFGMAS